MKSEEVHLGILQVLEDEDEDQYHRKDRHDKASPNPAKARLPLARIRTLSILHIRGSWVVGHLPTLCLLSAAPPIRTSGGRLHRVPGGRRGRSTWLLLAQLDAAPDIGGPIAPLGGPLSFQLH
jgi:hypothetical protein